MHPTIRNDLAKARIADCTSRPNVTAWPGPPGSPARTAAGPWRLLTGPWLSPAVRWQSWAAAARSPRQNHPPQRRKPRRDLAAPAREGSFLTRHRPDEGRTS